MSLIAREKAHEYLLRNIHLLRQPRLHDY